MGSTGLPWQAHGKRLICRFVAVLSLALCGCTPPVSHHTEAQAAAAAVATVKQLQEEILKRLEKYVTDAHVTAILLKAQNYKIYVTGKVNKPGDFVIGKPVNVMQAISMAGGLTPFASPGSIAVLRTIGGKEEVFPFNYKEVAKGQFLEQNRTLLPGDVVVVP